MASVVTLIIEKTMKKNIQKKNYFRPTDPNFSRYETATTGGFLRLSEALSV
jgi:hypothetical protein